MVALNALSLREEDVGRAAGVIARAFHDDPLNVHMFPNGDTRGCVAPLLFEAIVRFDQLFGRVDYLPGFTAVASWMRPGEALESPERLAKAGFDELPADVPLETFDAVFGFIGAAIADVAPEPHWHLRLLGVEPELQGGGLGAQVMRHGIDRAANTGDSTILETFGERSVRFYLRNGFDLLLDDVEPSSGLRFWALRHPVLRSR